jgi:hypothetical protein
MTGFARISDADLRRARVDPAFRRKLLAGSLDGLLEAVKKLKDAAPTVEPEAGQLREGVELAVKLAELLQNPGSKQNPGLNQNPGLKQNPGPKPRRR